MIRPAVTISLVEQARGGPFVFWDDLAGSMHRAAEIGFSAVEIFAPDARSVDRRELHRLCQATGLSIAAVGTGAGWVMHRLTLSDDEPDSRNAAVQFVGEMIDFGAEYGAPAIVGSMQGRAPQPALRDQTLARLAESMQVLAERAGAAGVPLVYEPLNRYETNLCNTLHQGVEFIEQHGLANVVLLADLFHMNIEEVDLAEALQQGSRHVGHVHFVDSNRRAAGYGHLDIAPVVNVLKSTGYEGYFSAEALPWPDSESAARQTMATFGRFVLASPPGGRSSR